MLFVSYSQADSPGPKASIIGMTGYSGVFAAQSSLLIIKVETNFQAFHVRKNRQLWLDNQVFSLFPFQ